MFARLVSAALGIWLMAAPAVLDYGEPAASADRIVGPLVASFSLIAAWEVTRALRWVNVALAVWLVVAPVLLGYPRDPLVNGIATGVLIGSLSLVRGRRKHRFAGGWRSLVGRERLSPG